MRTLTRYGFLGAAVFLALCGLETELHSNSGLPPAGRTGSPGDGGATCIACHGGGNSTNAAKFSFSGMPTQYALNQEYTIPLNPVGPTPPQGFEITAERVDTNGKVGTWTALSNTGVISANWVGQTVPNAAWSFKWRAPASDAGAIKMYVSGPKDYAGGGTYLANYTIAPPSPPPSITAANPAFGSAAESVTLTGTGFVGLTSTVTFGAANAGCSSGSDTSLTCAVPAGSAGADGGVNVTVTSTNGTSGAKTFFFISGAPNPTGVDPGFGSSTDTARAITLVAGSKFSRSAVLKLTRAGQTDIPATGTLVASTAAITAAALNLSGAATGQWNVVVTNPDGQSGALTNGYNIMSLPAAPAGPAGIPLSASSIRWQWTDASDNEDGFRLLSGTGGVLSADLPPGTVSYDETGLPGNAFTTRLVRAFNAIGSADSVTASTYTLTAAPTVPSALAVTTEALTFGWQQNNAAGTAYIAELATGPFASTPVLISSQTVGASATLASLSANTTYFLRVKARSYDNLDTAYSAQVATPTAANAPSASSLLSASSDTVSFNWFPNGDPAGTLYEAQASTVSGFAGALLSSATISSTAAFSGLIPNSTYYLRARAFNFSGLASPFDSTLGTVTLAAVPGTPAAVLREVTALTLQWNPSQNPPDTLYTVELSTNNFGPLLSSTRTFDTQAVFSGLTPAATYYFRAQATDRAGRPAGFSPAGSAKTLSAALSAPTGAGGSALGVSSIAWSWNAVAFAVSYTLYSATNTTPGAAFASGITATAFTQTGLTADQAATLRVAGVDDAANEGPLSAAATAYTLALPPTGTQAVALSSVSIRVQWNSSGASAYAVERSTVPGSSFSQAASSSVVGGASQSVDPGLSPSTTYYYRVRGFNGAGVPTGYDAEASTRTFPPIPAAPVLTGLAVSSGSIHWSWTVSGELSGLTLETSTGGVIAFLAASATQYAETGLSPATVVRRRLLAANASGNAVSDTASVATADQSLAVGSASSATLTGLDGQTRLDIPIGTLPGAGEASLSQDPVARPLTAGTAGLLSAADANLPAGLRRVPSALREFLLTVSGERFTGLLGSAVTLRIPYPDADNDGTVDGLSPAVKAGSLSLYTVNEALQAWEPVSGAVVDTANKVVVAAVGHLSVFALFGPPASADLAAVKVFPNPWRPGSGGSFDAPGVTFRNLTESATIKIFTVTGALVRRLEKTPADGNEKLWDGNDGNGRKAASGVFLYLVTGPGGQKRTGRVAIIR